VNLEHEAMTVPELKELCREQGLKVGGTKAELIERLSDIEETVSDEEYEKVELRCPNCNQRLRVPGVYTGGLNCPACSTKFSSDSSGSSSPVPPIITLQDPIRLNIIAGTLGFISIISMLGLLSVAGGLLMEPGLGLFLFCLVLWLTLPWVGFVMSKQAREIQKEKGDPDIVSLIMMIILGIQGVISALIFLYVISFFLLASMAFEG